MTVCCSRVSFTFPFASTERYHGAPWLAAAQVRDTLNNVAESWSDAEKEHCLEETQESFKVGAPRHLPRLMGPALPPSTCLRWRTPRLLPFSRLRVLCLMCNAAR